MSFDGEDLTHQLLDEPQRAACGIPLTGPGATGFHSTSEGYVTCPSCIGIASRKAAEGVGGSTPLPKEERMRRAWTIQVVGGDTDLSFAEWKYLHGHSNERPARHTPPRMEDPLTGGPDGVFIFYGTHSDLGGQLEVVPMSTGNVEFTISDDESQQGGLVFSLSHLDRADMLRALLHDFHYSREIGGPGDDDDQV